MDDFPNEEKVGYGKPPKKHQFKKGQSGNPKGRPPSTPIHTMLEEILNESALISMNGEKIDMTKKELILHQLVNKSVKGKNGSLKLLISLLKDLLHIPPF